MGSGQCLSGDEGGTWGGEVYAAGRLFAVEVLASWALDPSFGDAAGVRAAAMGMHVGEVAPAANQRASAADFTAGSLSATPAGSRSSPVPLSA